MAVGTAVALQRALNPPLAVNRHDCGPRILDAVAGAGTADALQFAVREIFPAVDAAVAVAVDFGAVCHGAPHIRSAVDDAVTVGVDIDAPQFARQRVVTGDDGRRVGETPAQAETGTEPRGRP